MDRLTGSQKVEVRFEWKGCQLQQTVTPAGFLQIAAELGPAIEQAVVKAGVFAGVDLADLDHVLLAGSIMHLRPVQEIVRKLLPRKIPISKIDKTEFARGAAIQAAYLSTLSTRGDSKLCGVGCTAYDFAFLAESQQAGKLLPRVLLEKATPLPASSSHTVRARAGERTPPTLQLIESSSLGDVNWLTLGQVKPSDLFPLRTPEDPLQLRLEVDENGILESSLLWPAGNRQARIPASCEPEMSEESIRRWRDWLDTVLLCADS
jgi:molecular chaperone DnaK (HSP70)